MSDFLLELRCEEIPARMQAGARSELEKLFRRELASAGIDVGDVTVWSTPRRLALIARGLPDATQAVSEEAKGPPEGAPEAALEGFCRKNGVTKDQLQLRDVKGRQTWFAVIERPGRATKDVLAEAIPAIVRDFAWPKSMRWGATSLSTESARWVRPLSGIVAILGEELVECEAAGVASGYATLGHRFHHAGVSQEKVGTGFSGRDATHKQLEITIGGASDYAEKLRACHVIVDHEERAALIREGAAKAAADAGLMLVEDEGLVTENAGLTEWPVPLLGRFDEAFLDVPPEVIQLTARVNQKYFVCTRSPATRRAAPANAGASSGGAQPNEVPAFAGTQQLASAFVCTANIAAADGGGAIVEGNRKVLAARLSDARFFWEQDRKTTLAEHAKKLERITFHEKLGTVADKVERVAKLARWLVESDIVTPDLIRGPASSGGALEEKRDPGSEAGVTKDELAQMAEDAARLAKADLVTEMVGEFPELQGVMGGYYARAEGLPDAVADAIRDHYKPVGQGDEVPTAPVTVAVSLADKLDTFVSFFAIGQQPTGSKDPFALRRSALGIIRLMLDNKLRASLKDLVRESRSNLVAAFGERFAMVSFDEDAGFDDPVPVYRAERGKAAVGETFIFDHETEPQTITSAGYPAYSRNYLWDLGSCITVGSLTDVVGNGLTYLTDRIAEAQRASGVRVDLIRSVLPKDFLVVDLLGDLGELGVDVPAMRLSELPKARIRNWRSADDPVNIVSRVQALQGFLLTEDGANLLAAYKRAANILKKEGWAGSAEGGETKPLNSQGIARTGEEDPLSLVDDPDMAEIVKAQLEENKNKALSYMPENAETALIAALDSAEPKASAAVEAEDFSAAMSALASLRAPIDRFFDEVTVNDPDQAKRSARLDLLARFRDAVHRVADFSRIEG